MDLSELTLGQLKELRSLLGKSKPEPCPYEVGKNYMIRTVTHYHTGKLVQVTRQELVLEDACWIADTGRFNKALASGQFNETEPFPAGRVIVGRGVVVDACLWSHPLPRSEK
jgi:hypothetical protein